MSAGNTYELGIENFPSQQEIFDHPAKFKIVVKGRRFGLTRGAAQDFIAQAFERKFTRGLWVDTVNENIDRYIERYFVYHLKQVPQTLWEWRKQAKMLEIAGSVIDFRSAQKPESIEGFAYDKVFLNEAGIILKNDYLWQNAIKPMLWDFQPDTVIGGTPKGKGLFYDLAMLGQSVDHPEYHYFHRTPFDNPFIDADIIREDILTTPDNVVQQEVYGKFIDDVGVVFRNFKRIMTAKPSPPQPGRQYVMGVDLAKVQDYTVIAIYDRSTNEQVYQDRFKKLEWPYQRKKIAGISRHFNNAIAYLDATGLGDPVADELLRMGVPVEPFKLTNTSKKEIIEKLSMWIETAKIKMIPISQTIDELSNFTYDYSKSGRVSYSAPVGLHDDIVIAHALAVWGLSTLQPTRQPEITPVQRTLLRRKMQLKANLEDSGFDGYEGDGDYEYV